jgi:hypothetical protein
VADADTSLVSEYRMDIELDAILEDGSTKIGVGLEPRR